MNLICIYIDTYHPTHSQINTDTICNNVVQVQINEFNNFFKNS